LSILAITGALAVASGVVYGAYSKSRPQEYEDKHLKALSEAEVALIHALIPTHETLIGPGDQLSFSRLEHIINLLEKTGDNQGFEAEITQFRSAWETYKKNLDSFIDGEIPGSTTYDKYIEAKSQHETHQNDRSEVREMYFEHRLEMERLNGEGSPEERAYAKVLEAREQLRLVKIYCGPTDHKGIISKRQYAYTQAVDTHLKEIKKWRAKQPGSDIDVYKRALQQAQEDRKPFIYQGREEALKIPSDLLKHRIKTLNSQISDLVGSISLVDPTLVGKPQKTHSYFQKFLQLFSFSSNPDKANVGNLVTAYKSMRTELNTLTSPRHIQGPESSPIAKTAQGTLRSFFGKMSLFDENVETFLDKNLSLPQGSQVEVQGNRVTITLPEAPSGRIDANHALELAQFQRLNRQDDSENLSSLKSKALKRIAPPSAAPFKLQDLTYFRSLGPIVTGKIKSGVTLFTSKKVVLEISGNTLHFVEGGPKIQCGSTSIQVLKMTLQPLKYDVAEQECGKVTVTTTAPWPIKRASDEYFLSDIGELLSLTQT